MNTSAQDTEVIDRAVILDRVGGDEDLLREITAIFLEEYPALIEEIRTAHPERIRGEFRRSSGDTGRLSA
jgi:hypothetical protein